MGKRTRPSITKRQKERARQERRRSKLERRARRQSERRERPASALEDAELQGIAREPQSFAADEPPGV